MVSQNTGYWAFVQQLGQAKHKEYIITQHYWPLVRRIASDHLLIFFPEDTKCIFPTCWSKKNKWISEFRRTNHNELKCLSSLCVNYFLRYYLMMQPQPVVKRVNGAHEWAHRPYQLLSSSLSLLLVQTREARWKAAAPEQLTGAHLYLDIAKSDYLFHGHSGGMRKCALPVCSGRANTPTKLLFVKFKVILRGNVWCGGKNCDPHARWLENICVAEFTAGLLETCKQDWDSFIYT